jgi:hypothetical protein
MLGVIQLLFVILRVENLQQRGREPILLVSKGGGYIYRLTGLTMLDCNLVLGRLFSVGSVEGAGASAKIWKTYRAYPGVHVDGVEQWLYPIPTPGST